MVVINKNEKAVIPAAVWTLRDVLIITIAIFAGSSLVYLCTLFLFGDSRAMFRLARYVGSLLMIILPVAWLKKRYMLTKAILGLKKGKLGLILAVTIGTAVGITYFLLAQIILFGYNFAFISFKNSYSFFHLILLPLSISGFATIILAPIGEEIMSRGFIYGYLRKKIGVLNGLFLQAFLFSLFHFNYFYGNFFNLTIHGFMVGLILGILYEKTGSLYPSIICHGTINYMTIIFWALRA